MSHPNLLSILACQIAVPVMRTCCDRDKHLARVQSKIGTELEKEKCDLVVLPELASIDYSRDAFGRLDELAEPLDGPSFATWSQLACEHDAYVAYSFPRRASDGFRITLAVVNPAGKLVGHYDKIHLAQYGASMEKEYFGRGAELFIFEVNGFKIAPIICYDIRIPELSRALAVDNGVEVILHSGAYYRDASFYSWHHFAISRAIENQIYFLSLNRAGENYGHSTFCRPWMDEERNPVLFAEHDEQLLRVMVDRREIDHARERYSFLSDRLAHYNLPQGVPRNS